MRRNFAEFRQSSVSFLLHSRPVARFFYGEVRSKEEEDQTRPEEQVSGVGWEGGGGSELGSESLRLYCERFAGKHGYFSKSGTSKLVLFSQRDNIFIIC